MEQFQPLLTSMDIRKRYNFYTDSTRLANGQFYFESIITLNSFQAHLAWSRCSFLLVFIQFIFRVLIISSGVRWWQTQVRGNSGQIKENRCVSVCLFATRDIGDIFLKPQSNQSHFVGLMRNLLAKTITVCVLCLLLFWRFCITIMIKHIFLAPTVRKRGEGRGVTEFDGQIMVMLLMMRILPCFLLLYR